MSQTGTIPKNACYLPSVVCVRNASCFRDVCFELCMSDHRPRWESQSCDAHVTSRVCRCVGGDSGAEEHRREAVGGGVVVGGARCLPRLRRHWCSLQRLLPRFSRSRHATLLPHAKILKLNLKSSHLRRVFMRLTVYACHIFFYTVICCFQSIKIVYATQTKDVTSPVALYIILLYFYLFYKACFLIFFTKG